MGRYEVYLALSGLLIMFVVVYGQWEFFKFLMVTLLKINLNAVEPFKPFFMIGGVVILAMALFLNAFVMWFITAFYSDIEFLKLLITSMNGFLGAVFVTVILILYPELVFSAVLLDVIGVIGDVISVVTMYSLLRVFGAVRREAAMASVVSWFITNLALYGMTMMVLRVA
ncbi:hypothetical protein JCM16161A_13660 [Vulcanisaeta sp. JCM 16161]|uniref:hypothetical protein n=1 Tax=Vulcanisaeta sp. JCM 16161 TaxID=1295372 RepID=UPI000B32CEA5|nr:hypothetical protein [Vulcanisaeta sp. JCM 16161]